MSIATSVAPDTILAIPRPVKTDWGGTGILVGNPLTPNQDNPQYVPNHRTICSVFPAELRTPERAIRSATWPQFVFPKPPDGGFTCHRVYDTVAIVQDDAKLNSPEYDPSREGSSQTLRPVPAVGTSGFGGLVHDIVTLIAGDMHGATSHRMLGLGMIASDLPSKQEFDSLVSKQNELFRFYVHEADGLAVAQKWDQIRDFHRFALEQLGDLDPERHPWHKDIQATAMKACLKCGCLIRATAQGCDHCQVDLVHFAYDRWKLTGEIIVDQKGDPIVWSLTNKAIKLAMAKVATPPPAAPPPPAPSPAP